jgi:hypothetical protein
MWASGHNGDIQTRGARYDRRARLPRRSPRVGNVRAIGEAATAEHGGNDLDNWIAKRGKDARPA